MLERVYTAGSCSELNGKQDGKQEHTFFLSHDSYANCAQPLRAKLEAFISDEMKYCGLLSEDDLTHIQDRIIASGMLTIAEIDTFFGKSIKHET